MKFSAVCAAFLLAIGGVVPAATGADVSKWDPRMAVEQSTVSNGVRWIDGRTVDAALHAAAKPGRETIVYVAAHPDDLGGSIGTMIRLSEKYDVHVVDYTHGERGLQTTKTNALRIRTEWDENARYEVFSVFPGTVPTGKGIFDSMEGVLR